MTAQSRHRLSESVNPKDHIRGPRSAAISLVEYGDFECPYCRAAEPIVAGLMEALGDQLSVTFRHFPMPAVHPHAQHAAEVAEAAAAQGKFWEMHDTLFANQHALDDASLLKYVADLALDAERVRREPGKPRTRWPRRRRSCEWSGKRRPRHAHLLHRRRPVRRLCRARPDARGNAIAAPGS